MLKLLPNYHLISYKSNCVIINNITGKWIRVSSELWEIIQTAVRFQMDKEELLENMFDSQDRLLISQVMDALKKINVLTNEKESAHIDLCPKTIYLSITHRCNLHCSHCCVSASSMEESEYSDTAQMKEFIEKILSLNPELLAITGGEPLVRIDFRELIEHIHRLNPNIKLCLMTNATCISIQNVDFLVRNFDSFDVSIDGVDENTCTFVRGAGVFQRVVSGVNLLRERGAKKISLSMVLTKENIKHETQFDTLCKELHVKPIKRIFEPVGRGKENYSLLASNSIQTFPEKGNEKQVVPVACTCGAGRYELSINPKGDVFLCHSLDANELRVGNLLEIYNLKEFMSGQAYQIRFDQLSTTIFPWHVEPCRECPVNYFCWKCPALFKRAQETPGMIEERCKVKKKALLTAVWGEREEMNQ